jgi:hypothetical protein
MQLEFSPYVNHTLTKSACPALLERYSASKLLGESRRGVKLQELLPGRATADAQPEPVKRVTTRGSSSVPGDKRLGYQHRREGFVKAEDDSNASYRTPQV